MLLDVFLPLSLAFIMFSLGLGLTPADFARVGAKPLAFAVGAATQMLLLPAVALGLVLLFAPPPELALGVMILSFCPGGVTSNILTRLAGGAVALSITLTAAVSLLSVITVPFLVAWAAVGLMGEAAPAVDVGALGLAMFAITAAPVALGVAIRAWAPDFAGRFEPLAARAATALFALIVIGALAANWGLFVENLPVLGPLLVLLNVVMLALGVAFARLMRLSRGEGLAIALEAGVQNATLGIAVSGLIAAAATGLPAMALPSGVYGITMYLVTLPFILWARRGA